jgi:midasin
MHSEAADFLGGLKPVRNKSSSDRINDEVGLFEWQDGVVVKAMQDGCCLLIDEISLADDAVLERLNSVLERERRLLVSERSRSQGQTEVFQITAAHGFVFMATMNPGGDYGKKELSPALRNRFVEVWCPSTIGDEDLGRIIDHNLKSSLTSGLPWSGKMLRLLHLIKPIISCEFSVRDLLTWTQFMNATSPPLTSAEAFYHGAHLTCLDGLGCGGQMSGVDRENALAAAEGFLKDLLPQSDSCSFPQDHSYNTALNEDLFGIHPFFITKGPFECQQLLTYSLDSPGPHENALRLLRGMQVGKPLLIEGPPGVGKTSLVTALAKASGHHLTRINLSEHTDVSDLFGCDLPVEGGKSVRFAWRDGPLLRALKAGDWVLLDEINLASQSVLEGLNAVLDHRGEVFVPELGLVFTVQPDTMLFACQNPMSQGGGRKGLPKSFLNRFTMVFIDVLSAADLEFISHSLYPDIPLHMLNNMISFNNKVEVLVRKCGATLWEFNLRDVLRWCQLMQDYQASDPGQFVDLLYCRRLRSAFLRAQVIEVYCEVFGEENLPLPYTLGGYFNISDRILQVGCSFLPRQPSVSLRGMDESSLLSLHCQYPILEAIMICVERRWMTLLVGGGMSGKSSVICVLAQLIGRKLVEFPMNSDTDTTELLGGFQQVNTGRHYTNLANRVENVCQELLGCLMHIQGGEKYSAELLAMLNTHLLDSSRILQEYSTDELLLHCEKVKECLLKINDISRALQIPLCYGINEMLLEVSMLVDQVREANSGGQFEWVDSVLVTAVRCGHWLCISNANFCSPSVLDRLNPLMEPGGVLHMDERGVVGDGVVAVTPHSDFRLFLLMDPAHGEISRAMRNRGIEICILPEDTLGTFSKHKEDWRSLISTSGLNNLQAAKFVDSCSMAVDDVSPVKVLQTLHCSNMAQSVTSSQNPLWKYLDVHSVLLSCELSDAWRYTASFPTLLNAMCAQPKLMMALSHFSALLHTFNQHMSNPVVRDASLVMQA